MINGFKLLTEEYIEDINSKGYIYKHYTGLTLVYIQNEDTNRVFSITFKTPSKDNTGVAHILEHCVLAGSKKYPLKDPFNELAKSKLYSYLNAITFKDKTMYPIGSYNEEELFDMADVYLDAVFNPLIFDRKEVFLQEGWHYTLGNKGKYTYNGIVYNEMRSVYTDTLYLLKRISYKALFPNTEYKYDSAGEPSSIVNLSYKKFIDYYKETYVPENALIYLYGDLDISKYLNYINAEYLQPFTNNKKKIINNNIQESLKEPVFIFEECQSQTSTHLCAAYVIDTIDNIYLVHAFTILASYLLEFEASPLRQELYKVGTSITYEFEVDLLQPTFFIVIKDAHKGIDEFKNIISKCIIKIINSSLDKELLDISISKYEFSIRKEDYGYKPNGLGYNIDMISSYISNNTSFSALNKIKVINSIKENKHIFVKILNKYILNNPHSSYTTLKGCTKSNITTKNLNLDLNTIKLDIKKMKAFQKLKEDKDIINKIPCLDISNINIYPRKYIVNVEYINGFKLIHAPIDLNNVISLSLCFDISRIPKELLPYIGLYILLIGKLGTKKYTHNELSRKINYYFGYMSPVFNLYTNYENKSGENLFELKTQFLESNIEDASTIIEDILLNTNFNNPKLIKKTIMEHKLKMESWYQNEGHGLAIERVRLHISKEYSKRETIIGLEFYEYLKVISKDLESNLNNIIKNLKILNDKLFIKENFKALSISNKGLLPKIKTALNKIYLELSSISYKEPSAGVDSIKNTMFITKSNTYNNAMGFNFTLKNYKYSGKLKVVSTILNTTYLQNEVRVKGGAYGVCSEVSREGYIIFYSYRDPNIDKTIEVFKGAYNFLKNFNANKEEMKKYIIATINLYDKPLHCYKVGERDLYSYMCGVTHKQLVQERNDILKTQLQDIKDFGKVMESYKKTYTIITVGNAELISKNEKFNFSKTVY